MDINLAYEILFTIALIVIVFCIGATIIKSVYGPRLTDRIVSVNMISTCVTSCIIILSVCLDHSYLLDMGLIYVIISFLSVVVLTNVFVNKYEENKEKDGDQ